LYEAFDGARGPELQRHACEELARALAGMLRQSQPDLLPSEHEDVIQNALERIWRARASCRLPIAFLSFAASHLRSAIQQSKRQLQRLGEPLRPASGDDGETIEISDEAPQPLAQVLNQERRADVLRFLSDLRAVHPRARHQIEILELRWLEDLDYAEICARLHISLSNAQTRLSRILHTIRTDPELLRQARELGLS
jgi:RNA polymerase sigma factor (sigma-70 family)